VTPGEVARFVSVPPDVDFCWAWNVCVPVDEPAVAPGPPPPVAPYVIVKVAPPESVSEETVIVWPDTETVPEVDVV
jgi:hypothetical protein